MYVCMYGNKHLHNKSQETLSISCYTSCEGLGLAKTTKNVKNCKCRGKSSGFVFFGWSVCWCRDRSLFCSVLQRNQPKHNWHPCSSWISVEGHTLRPASVPLLKRASKKVVSGSVVYPETAGQNRWSYRATSYMWRRVDLCFLPSHKPWEQRFSFLSPSKFLKPCERRRSQALCVDVCFVMLCEVVTPHETFLTLIALKAFVSWKQTKKEENLNPDASHLYLVHVCIWSLHTCVCPGVSL